MYWEHTHRPARGRFFRIKNTVVRMDSGIRKHKMCLFDIGSLPYGRIDYIRFKGTGLRQTISAFLRP